MITIPAPLYDELVKRGEDVSPYHRSEKLPAATDPAKDGKRKTALEVLQTGNRADRRRAWVAIKKANKIR